MNYIILHTSGGKSYARKIVRSLNWIKDNKSWGKDIERVFSISINRIDEIHGFIPENTVIYARAAHPDSSWMRELQRLESLGFTVINNTNTLKLTSDKLACSLHLQGKVNHPKTWEYNRQMTIRQFDTLINEIETSLDLPQFIIAKPLTSLEQGANVKKIDISDVTNEQIRNLIDDIPGNKIVVQEYVPYTALHRVIVINGKSLPYTFIDKPEWHSNGDWKVSCCLNRTTMQLNEHPSRRILDLAEQTQVEINGKINFIDIFEHNDDVFGRIDNISYTISEINTACNLSIHERLARNAGRIDWNIHARIARQLVKELGV